MIAASDDGHELERLIAEVRVRHHHDFREYARASLQRRARAAATKLGCASLAELREMLARRPEAFPTVLETLTVRVTELFRDPWHFESWRTQIVPRLRTYPTRRVWVAGCASGEEAYSLAVVLAEEGLLERTIIYATDISAGSLRIAQAGVYPVDRVMEAAARHAACGGRRPLTDWCRLGYGGAIFDAELRRRIVFADHSLATDAVFAEVHVVSCRNVMIYFDEGLQDRALGLFADAVVRGGFLGLGSAETLDGTRVQDCFKPLPGTRRWFQRTHAGRS